MNIYFIAPKDIFKTEYINNLNKFGSIIYCTNDNLENTELMKKDISDKIIIYDPDYAGWNFPISILENVNNIKSIFLGTTDKSYINLNLCKEKNIDIINIPKYASQSVAEYLFMYMFALAKKIPMQIKNNNKQEFEDAYMQIELTHKSVGIVGLGNIGVRLAEMCSGIGMDVYYWNRTKKENKYKYRELPELFEKCDIIFICLSINDETKKIISDDLINNIKKNCIFISATGKQLINSKLVEEKVTKNEIFGYAFEQPNTKLIDYDGNIMVTSEYGWFTKEASNARIEKWYNSVIDYLNKK